MTEDVRRLRAQVDQLLRIIDNMSEAMRRLPFQQEGAGSSGFGEDHTTPGATGGTGG